MINRIKSHLRSLRYLKNAGRNWHIERMIRTSGMLDGSWYLNANPDVKLAAIDPVKHYVRHGANEGRNPNRDFSSRGYLAANPDVANAGINPLLHYIKWGRNEGRDFPMVNMSSTIEKSDSSRKESPYIDTIYKNYMFRIDVANENFIRGWCVDTSNRSSVAPLKLFINGIFFAQYYADGARPDLQERAVSDGLGGFRFENPIKFMGPGEYALHFQFQDGTLSDEITLTNHIHKLSKPIHHDDFIRNGITIIVPVYNAPDDVSVCIERLIEWTPIYAKILIINDNSTDDKIESILENYSRNSRITILRNRKNLGFTRTCNKGIKYAGRDDIVLLNSDARVTPGWLEGILIAATSSPKIATVTPMSDRAGAFSSPKIGNDNELPNGVDEISFAKSFRRSSAGVYPSVPTGNGFCMFIKRACIDEVGELDEVAFPRGYGEENDFCMRALHAGWRHIIDDRTYIFHDRTKSFGEEKTDLLANGSKILSERYPEYKSLISVFRSDVKINTARYNGYIAQNGCLTGVNTLPRVLFVISTTTGGTPQTNKDLIAGLDGSIDAWLLGCDRRRITLSHFVDGDFKVIQSYDLKDEIEPISHFSPEYDSVVFSWLFEFDIDIVHIRHLAWHSLSLPSLAKKLGRKTIFSFHDYYTLSPTIKLLDDAGVFLGDYFCSSLDEDRESLWRGTDMPLPTGQWLETWRKKFSKSLMDCDAFITTSSHARKIILEKMPDFDGNRFFVIPHGRDFEAFHQLSRIPTSNEPIKILVPGNISKAKGLDIIYNILDMDKEGRLEFHILGALQKRASAPPAGLFHHGTYDRDLFASKVGEIAPHIGAVFSIWDETYCHTLTELWSVGIPAIVFDYPTLAGRVKESGGGWVMSQHDISSLYHDILRVAFDEDEMSRVRRSLNLWQSGEGTSNSVKAMASKYFDIYRNILSH